MQPSIQKALVELGELIGAEHISTDRDMLETYGLDWTRFYAPNPCAVVFPKSIEMVQQIVRFAVANKIALVPSGGRTGLSGGAVASYQELVVSFDKMNKILGFNDVEQTVEVEAGVVTQVLQEFAQSHDLQYPVDFASSGSSQIGGNIATNAGGIKVIRYGLTRDWIKGLTVVTGGGEVLNLNKSLVKNATGYDFRHLFIGSEGSLGFVVNATIQLAPPAVMPEVLLLAADKMTDIIKVLSKFREAVTLNAFEFFSEAALQHVLREREKHHPFEAASDFYVLLEFEKSSDAALEAAMDAFEFCVAQGWVSDGVLSQSDAQRSDLWSYREDISESITPFTPYKNDVSVRIDRVPEFLETVDALVQSRYPDFEIVWFGHIGDGNVHLNILRPLDMDVAAFKKECEIVSRGVMQIVGDFEGSVSAEHGVGLLKKEQIGHTRSVEEIAAMKAVKQVFDPAGIMNPGKVI